MARAYLCHQCRHWLWWLRWIWQARVLQISLAKNSRGVAFCL